MINLVEFASFYSRLLWQIYLVFVLLLFRLPLFIRANDVKATSGVFERRSNETLMYVIEVHIKVKKQYVIDYDTSTMTIVIQRFLKHSFREVLGWSWT